MPFCYFKKPTFLDFFYLIYSSLRFCDLFIRTQHKVLQSNSLVSIVITSIAIIVTGIFKQFYDLYKFYNSKQKQVDGKHMSFKKSTITKIGGVFEHKKRVMTIIVITVLALFYLMGNYIQNIIIKHNNEYFQVNVMFQQLFQLILNIVFTRLIVKTNFYKHHYVSFGLVMIGIVGLHCQYVKFYSFLNTVPYYFLFSLIWCCAFPYAKIIMERKYIHPLNLSFYWGLGILVFFSILYLLIFLIGIDNQYTQDVLQFPTAFKALFDSKKETLLIIVFFLIQGSVCNGFLFIIYYNTPITENLLIQMVSIYEWIYKSCITQLIDSYFFLSLCGSILLLLGSLINFEILVINYFDLEKNTTEAIIQRSNKDIESAMALFEE